MVNESYPQFDDYAAADDDYLKVSAGEGEEYIEFPKEEDGSVMFSLIQSQFPDAVGLKCCSGSGRWKSVEPVNDALFAPQGGWGQDIYLISLSDENNNPIQKEVLGPKVNNPNSEDNSIAKNKESQIQKKNELKRKGTEIAKVPDLMSIGVTKFIEEHYNATESIRKQLSIYQDKNNKRLDKNKQGEDINNRVKGKSKQGEDKNNEVQNKIDRGEDKNKQGKDETKQDNTGKTGESVDIDFTTEDFPSLHHQPTFMQANSECPADFADNVLMPKTKNSEKLEYLMEMFPDVPETQLRKCLSRSKSNVEKAVAIILSNRNDDRSCKVNKKEKEQLPTELTEEMEKTEKDMTKLAEMFPRLSESRLRDRYYVVGCNMERAMRVIVQEEESRANGHLGKNFQVHKTSFKKVGLTEQDESKLKKDAISKYFYMVDDREKEHHPVLLVKKGSNKVGPIGEENKSVDIGGTIDNCKPSVENKVESKQSNPKLNRKQRHR